MTETLQEPQDLATIHKQDNRPGSLPLQFSQHTTQKSFFDLFHISSFGFHHSLHVRLTVLAVNGMVLRRNSHPHLPRMIPLRL